MENLLNVRQGIVKNDYVIIKKHALSDKNDVIKKNYIKFIDLILK